MQASTLINSLNQFIDSQANSLVAIRRHLHQHPELSGREFETTEFIAGKLREMGVPCRLGPDNRGLVVDLGHPEPTRRLAIRADLDAIPVQDAKQVDYRSSIDSVMHACGHDAHATILLGVIESLSHIFSETQPEYAVRAIFQPEEETATGARRMIEFGALDGVDAILGAHVDPKRAVGTVALRSGVVTAHCTEVFVEVIGQGGHAARPHDTIDPIETTILFVSACNSINPRAVDALHPFVLSFTCIHGGQEPNIIPDRVEIKGTLRTVSEESRKIVIENIHRIAQGMAAATGAQIKVEFGTVVPSVIANSELTRLAQDSCIKLLGQENVIEMYQGSMGGEDFAFYSKAVPAAFLRMGCAGANTGHLPLHNSGFDIDERVLPLGVKALTTIALDYFSQ